MKCRYCKGSGVRRIEHSYNDGYGWYVDIDWDICDECGGSGIKGGEHEE